MAEAGIAVALLSTALQSKQASDQRRKAEQFRRRREELEKANALQAQRIAMSEIAAQQFAEADSAATEVEANLRAAERAKGTATTIAGEAGSFGLSYQALIADFERQRSEFENAVETNLKIKRQFAALNLKSAEANTRARILNAQTMPVPRPNYANYAIQGINLGLSISSAYKGKGG